MRRKILLCMAAFACISCGAVNKHRPPTSESDCIEAGGAWTQIDSLPVTRYCDQKTGDAGKWCIDSQQCEGFCVAKEKATPGSFGTGQCSDHTQDYGTKKIVNWGKVAAPAPVL